MQGDEVNYKSSYVFEEYYLAVIFVLGDKKYLFDRLSQVGEHSAATARIEYCFI